MSSGSGSVLDITINTSAAAAKVAELTEILDAAGAAGEAAAAAIDVAGIDISEAMDGAGTAAEGAGRALDVDLAASAGTASSALEEAGNAARQTANAVEEAGNKAEGAGKKFEAVEQSLTAFKAACAGASAAIIALGVKSINAGAAVLNTGVQYRTIFRDVADEAAEMSKRLSKELGQGEGTIQGMMQRIGGNLQQLGVSAGSALQLSAQMARLATNMQDFTGGGMQAEQMLSALVPALDGMYRGIKQLGIYIDDTKISDYAKAHGILDKELSKAQKASIVLALAQQQLASRFDMARTPAENYNVALRHMNEAIGDMHENIGIMLIEALRLPAIFQTIADVVNALNEWFGSLSNSWRDLIVSLGGGAALVGVIAGIGVALSAVVSAFGGAFVAIAPACAAVSAVVVLLYKTVRDNFAAISAAVKFAVEDFGAALGKGKAAVDEWGWSLQSVTGVLAKPLIYAIAAARAGLIVLSATWNLVETAVRGASTVVVGFYEVMTSVWGRLLPVVGGALKEISAELEIYRKEMQKGAGDSANALIDNLASAPGQIDKIYNDTRAALSKVGQAAQDEVKPAVEQTTIAVNALGVAFQNTFTQIPGLIRKGIDALSGLKIKEKLQEQFTREMENIDFHNLANLDALEVKLNLSKQGVEDALGNLNAPQGRIDAYRGALNEQIKTIENQVWLSAEEKIKLMIEAADRMRGNIEQINAGAQDAAKRIVDDYSRNSDLSQLFRENGLNKSLQAIDEALAASVLDESTREKVATQMSEAIDKLFSSGLKGKAFDDALNNIVGTTQQFVNGMKRNNKELANVETKYAQLALAGSAEAYKQMLAVNATTGREDANARNLEEMKRNSDKETKYLEEIKNKIGNGNKVKIVNVAL